MLQRDDAHWEQWKRELLRGLQEEFERQARSEDLGQRLFGEEAAKGISLVDALGRKYDVIVTNPPYAGSGNLGTVLKRFVAREYKAGKRDLYAAFIERCIQFGVPNGVVGLVSQRTWLFLSSFLPLRQQVLNHTSLMTLADLGAHAFEEISGEFVNVVLFTLRLSSPERNQRITALRLVGSPTAQEKALKLASDSSSSEASTVFTPFQLDISSIPGSPVAYWLTKSFIEALKLRQLKDVAQVLEGLHPEDVERFVRYCWEVPKETVRWFRFARGGGYSKWAGLTWYRVNWENDGREIKAEKAIVPSKHMYFMPGLTFSRIAQGSLSLRIMDDTIFSDAGHAIFHQDRFAACALLNSRAYSFLLRSISPKLDFSKGYVERMPVPECDWRLLRAIAERCVHLKKVILAMTPVEDLFVRVAGERQDVSLCSAIIGDCLESEKHAAILHALEGDSDSVVFSAFSLSEEDIELAVKEVGIPAGWLPEISGLDRRMLGGEADIQLDDQHDAEIPPRDAELSASRRSEIRQRLRELYIRGPGSGEAVDKMRSDSNDEQDEEAPTLATAIPSESFIEELSLKLRIHPISVYRLIHEIREQEGMVSPPLIKQALEDYASVTILRLLGYRWPEQDDLEREHGPILDPAMVDEDGIIPLVPCADQPTALERVRMRLERDFGPEGAEQSEREFRQWIGRDLDDWLRREFFKRHVQRFKQRPIAWHLVSPERTFEAFVLYHKLSQETLQK
ncbi:MAG TPA: Eco57I restriction-modification methylase domain-containing protein, partial [Methylomirabilota bacterium]|nr:Eco57I restriction-modification methylase domain-containing protein [Methylomirabilota bacterium]